MTDETMFNQDPLDPEAAKVADKYIQAVKEQKQSKDRIELSQAKLLGILRKTNRQQIRHGGYLIKILHKPETDKLQLVGPKSEKKKKTTRKYHAIAD
jgi:hypothetical protein